MSKNKLNLGKVVMTQDIAMFMDEKEFYMKVMESPESPYIWGLGKRL